MSRLTYRLGEHGPHGLNDKASAKIGLFTDYDGFFAHLQAVEKLGKYEDILYDDDGTELVSMDRLGELVAMDKENPCSSGRWIPVTERLPGIVGDYVCCFDDGFIATVSMSDGWELWADAGEVTHWMPLPKPPEITQEDKPKCCWSLESPEWNSYKTSCGNSFTLEDGSPQDNGMEFCPYCGKEIQ